MRGVFVGRFVSRRGLLQVHLIQGVGVISDLNMVRSRCLEADMGKCRPISQAREALVQ